MTDAWFVRRGGKQGGPISLEKLRQLASAGKVTPTDEVAQSASGPWRAAKTITGLFVPAADEQWNELLNAAVGGGGGGELNLYERPISISHKHDESLSRYTYKCVQIPPEIWIEEIEERGTEAASYLQSVIEKWSEQGWDYYRVESIGVNSLIHYVVVFRRFRLGDL